ncbi:MAG TPA: twin-arginine translocase subunit TatC [Gemmataceae bacterium]|nr:twin-arginine translocase subunit TatC [Gemmataceae bacterium]
MSSNGTPKDPDDFFSETRMTFGDHIEELRIHLWRAIAGFAVALFLSFFIGKAAVDFITAPVKQQLRAFYNRRVEKTMKDLQNDPNLMKVNEPTGFIKVYFRRDQLQAVLKNEPAEKIDQIKRPLLVGDEKKTEESSTLDKLIGRTGDKEKPKDDEEIVKMSDLVGLWMSHGEPLKETGLLQEATRIVGDFDSMATLNVMEAFMVWFKVCMVCGFILGSPWIFWQIWMFVAAGLYPNEKKLVHVYLPVSLGLFLAGVLLCEFLVIPRAIEALLWFNEWLGLKPDLRLNEWLSFAIFMPLVFGLSFQTPLVMLFAARLGVVNADTFRNKRRYAWMGLAVFTAIITPTPDALTMMFLLVPMCLLFELGIWLIKMTPNEPDLDADVPDSSEEMIEV